MDERAKKATALHALSIHRQVTIEADVSVAYLAGVEDLPAWAVAHACRVLGFRKREPYEKAWPELGDIRAIAEAAVRQRAEQAHSRRLLEPPPTPPADKARLAQFLEDVKAVIRKKGF